VLHGIHVFCTLPRPLMPHQVADSMTRFSDAQGFSSCYDSSSPTCTSQSTYIRHVVLV
jgi:hypothetical protein